MSVPTGSPKPTLSVFPLTCLSPGVLSKINQNTKRLRDALWTACGGFQQIRRGDLPLDRPLALSSNGSTLSLESGSVGFINVLSGNSQWTSGNEEHNVLAIQFSPNDSFLAIAGMDSNSPFVYRHNVFTYGFLCMLGGNGDTLCLCFHCVCVSCALCANSTGGRHMASRSLDRTRRRGGMQDVFLLLARDAAKSKH